MKVKKDLHPPITGMTLFEILIVISVVGLLMAISAPAFITLGPTKQGAIQNLKLFIEDAQHAAIRDKTEIYIAFANESAPEEAKWKRYAYFAPVDPDDGGALITRPLKQVSKWQNLPAGLVFASGEHFNSSTGSFKTLLDASIRREFEFYDTAGEATGVTLPFLMFTPKGGVAVPPIVEADTLYFGLADGLVGSDGNRIFQGQNSDGLPRTECLAINFYTGKARIITR